MSMKKAVVLYIVFMAMACTLVARLFVLVNDTELSRRVRAQTTASVQLSTARPDFFDRNGEKLTGAQYSWQAVVDPRDVSSYNLLQYVLPEDAQSFKQGLSGSNPFTVMLRDKLPSWSTALTIRSTQRYGNGLPVHLIGYLNGEGEGVSGLEIAFEKQLSRNSVATRLSYQVDAFGRMVQGTSCVLEGESAGDWGVKLSIDKTMQSVLNEVAQSCLSRGAIVLTECSSGEILACTSMPDFDPRNVAAAIAEDNGALLNRVLVSYNAGSVFKMVVQAAALEAGISPDYSYECTGSISVGDTTFWCMNGNAHGTLDMRSALAYSCNCYHIALARQVGALQLRNMAVSLGFSAATQIWGSYRSAHGIVPTLSQLENEGELCNFAFGQGLLQVTPLQIAAYVECIANGGIYKPCSLVLEVGDDKTQPIQGIRVMSERTAEILRENMLAVVVSGTGKAAQADSISVAGKSSTAETGMTDSSGGKVIVTWFAGFFPAENPRYILTVVSEMNAPGAMRAAAVFRNTVEAITQLSIAKNEDGG